MVAGGGDEVINQMIFQMVLFPILIYFYLLLSALPPLPSLVRPNLEYCT